MKNPRNMIGPAIRRIRSSQGFSQPALVEIIQRKGWDISRDTLAKIEDQRRWVSDFELVFLATILKVHIRNLLPDRALGERAAEFISRLERKLL